MIEAADPGKARDFGFCTGVADSPGPSGLKVDALVER